eukprot:TRINITY_DN15916_c0_g1_i1.p1 TRINITY_DN15916_c0_g1~~TRINITY_DN15916_c0_g1_i1.p1  ORF type:complete len:420 (-),score=113.49 TRINITY_DN15916_c0_g1_i1:87-1172(-)
MAKNHRQPYAVSRIAGHQTSAESWGTGRAVARIPRVPGGGTHRAGQGAFGNMCRGGRMFSPTKTWRKWHRKINVNQKRFALASAVSASGIPALVTARGHRIDQLPEIPFVLSTESVKGLVKTKQAVALLKSIGAYDDVQRVALSRKIRRGKGKMRNRRRVQKKGPLIVYLKKRRLVKSFRNIPGVDLISVERLNLLELAPGGHLGRFVIWIQDAFDRLDKLYGTYSQPSTLKKGYSLPPAKMTNADLNRIINSDEIQSFLRNRRRQKKHHSQKKNPLKNRYVMFRLNPFEKTRIRKQLLREERAKKLKDDPKLKQKKKLTLKRQAAIKKGRKPFYQTLLANPTIYETSTPQVKKVAAEESA